MTLIHVGDRVTLDPPDGPRREGYVVAVTAKADRTTITMRLNGAGPVTLEVYKGTHRPAAAGRDPR